MEKTDVLIVGAGCVGLAAACRVSSRNLSVVVVEKNDGFGKETSSRNSEVIHAGIYYPSSSLKTMMCVKGRRTLYELCERENISYKKTGKLIIACDKEEIVLIEKLYEQGRSNNVEGLEMLSKRQVDDIEPEINATAAILSPETGIFDTHKYMSYLEHRSEKNGCVIVYECEVVGVEKDGKDILVNIKDNDGEMTEIKCGIVINAAGLYSDMVASMCGIDIDQENYRIYPCKGEYFSVSNRHRNRISHLIYPVPSAGSLGIHTVSGIGGGFKLGPSAFYTDQIDYAVNENHSDDFYNSVSRYLPFIEKEDLYPDMSGIRPKIQPPGGEFKDFVIRRETEKGIDGLINCIGIDSPGLTASMSIAEYIERLL